MGTLIEEILSRKVGRPVRASEIILVDVDYIMSHDNTTPLAIKAFREIGKPILDKNKIVLHFDHAYPAPNLLAAEAQKLILDFVKEQELPHLYRQGICHQVMIEEGYITPGAVIIGADSHSNTYGALGAFGTGLGSTEIGAAWVTGMCWFKVPETIRIELTGKPQAGVYSKDIMIYIAGLLGMDGGTYRSIEFAGDYIDLLPMHERIIFPNMSTEIGAKCGLIAADQTTLDYLASETSATGPYELLKPIQPKYERVVEVDVSQLGPQIACHPDVDHVKPIEQVAGLPVDEVFIGTCTNARYEDLKIVAAILKGKTVYPFTRVIVTPASAKIYRKALNSGLIDIFLAAGCIVTGTGCGACIGRHGGILAPGERALTTMNRNFIGRMGSPQAEIYLASPAVAAVTALTGKITDPRSYLEVLNE
jgi:3-isopropylmalate/(R)-2-methylmalate dehydratase large subunit